MGLAGRILKMGKGGEKKALRRHKKAKEEK